MKPRLVVLLVFFVISFCTTANAHNHYVGLIHLHTTYCDGERSIETWYKYAAKNKLDFLGVTCHAAGVDNPTKEINLKKQKTGKVGYENFVAECHKYSELGNVTLFPCVEFGDVTDNNSHFLGLFIYDPKIFYEAYGIYKKHGQRATIDYLYTRNIPVVIPHPDLTWRTPKGITKYHFDRVNVDYNKISAIGLFNNGNIGAHDSLISNISLQLEREQPFGVIGDCDYHTELAEISARAYGQAFPFPDSLKRLTVIYCNDKTPQSLYDAIRSGRTSALYEKAPVDPHQLVPSNFIENLDYQIKINSNWQRGDPVFFSFDSQFTLPISGTYQSIYFMRDKTYRQTTIEGVKNRIESRTFSTMLQVWPAAPQSLREILKIDGYYGAGHYFCFVHSIPALPIRQSPI